MSECPDTLRLRVTQEERERLGLELLKALLPVWESLRRGYKTDAVTFAHVHTLKLMVDELWRSMAPEDHLPSAGGDHVTYQEAIYRDHQHLKRRLDAWCEKFKWYPSRRKIKRALRVFAHQRRVRLDELDQLLGRHPRARVKIERLDELSPPCNNDPASP